MILKILGVIVLVLVVIAVAAALQSPDFKISRSAVINAPPATVFAQVNDFHRWNAWSPWAKLDPNMKQTFTGPAEGKGAFYSWTGNSQVGEGSMAITDSHPAELVRIDLRFLRPFKGQNVSEFTFTPVAPGTDVTWMMSGQKNFVMKAIGLFVGVDKMIGGDFEKGLAQLKSVSEGAKTRGPAVLH